MTHSTPYSKWIKAILLDTILIGGFGYALYIGHETAQSVYAFFYWWMSCISLLLMFFLAVIGSTKDVVDDKGEPKGQKVYDAVWNEKLVNNFACSRTFFAYHILTDLLMIVLLLLSGRWILGSFKMFTFIGSCMMIFHARELKQERASTVL